MNVIKIHGGLGNQLFQYAFGQVQKKNGIDVCYDISWFNHSQAFLRPYILDKFQVDVKLGAFRGTGGITENGLFNIEFVTLDNFDFDGYWQFIEYYKDIVPLLKKQFWVKKKTLTNEYFELKEQIINCNSISLHVRRGDLLVNTRDYAQTLDYYQRALKIMKQLKKNCRFFIFSDDMEWCRENFKEENVVFISLIEYLDFELMKLCKHNIIANSTFSWWASFLNENNDKTIIAPRKWRGDSRAHQLQFEKGLYLKEWILL